MIPRLTAARVAVVSGKGGVGKTTVAAALAIAAARAGKRTLLVEVESREGIGPLFGLSSLGYEERALAPGLTGLSVEADEALVEYLYLFWGIRHISRALVQTKAIDFATNTAPGLRDILLIGKVKEAERRRAGGAYVFDLIVMDAPPTGRLPRLLDAPRAIVDLVHGGPVHQQAQAVLDMVTDPKRCQVILVAAPEEMPVRETLESAETIRKMGIALGPVIVNGIWPEAPALGDDPADMLRVAAEAAGLPLGPEAIARLAAVAEAHARRARLQRRAIRTLQKELPGPEVHLPFLFTPKIGPAEVGHLATVLAESEES